MPPRKKAASAKKPVPPAPAVGDTPVAAVTPAAASPATSLTSLPSRALHDPIGTAKLILTNRQLFWPFAFLLAALNLVLGIAIIWKVPCEFRS